MMQSKRNYCSAMGCLNKRDPRYNIISFFRFPREYSRAMLWAINCNRKDLFQKDSDDLYRHYLVCADHFEQSMFINEFRNRLKNTAVPTVFAPPKLPSAKSKDNLIVEKSSVFEEVLIKPEANDEEYEENINPLGDLDVIEDVICDESHESEINTKEIVHIKQENALESELQFDQNAHQELNCHLDQNTNDIKPVIDQEANIDSILHVKQEILVYDGLVGPFGKYGIKEPLNNKKLNYATATMSATSINMFSDDEQDIDERQDSDSNAVDPLQLGMQDENKDYKNFNCYICDFSSNFKRELAYHIKKHVVLSKKDCRRNYMLMNTDDQKREKRNDETSSESVRVKYRLYRNKYKCRECNFRTGVKHRLIEHCMTHKSNIIPIKDYQEVPPTIALHSCSYCNYKSESLELYYYHLKVIHPDTPLYKCSFCIYKTTNERDFIKHMCHLHTYQKLHKCDECSFITRSKKVLQLHIRRHQVKTNFVCTECKLCFSANSILMKHMTKHNTDEKDFNIFNKCTTDIEKNNHQSLQVNRLFQCIHCGYSAPSEGMLQVHSIKHNIQYNCTMCDFRTTIQNNLIEHSKLMHNLLQPYSCTLCDYRSSRVDYVEKHMKLHLVKGS